MSPDGRVTDFKSEYWTTEETNSENGIFEVAATSPGTFAETGIVHDVRPGHDDPVEGATITYESLQGRGLAAPPGGAVQVTTKTGYGGAYAFIDVPVSREGSCYKLVISAEGLGRSEAVSLIEPDIYDNSGIELDGGIHRESSLEQTRGKQAPPLYRACAARADR